MNEKLDPITIRKMRNIGATLRVAAQAIEQSDLVTDTLWLTDTQTVCDALLSAADEIIEIADRTEEKNKKSEEPETRPPLPRGTRVKKKSGGEWQGRIVGEYGTELDGDWYSVESEFHKGVVQLCPRSALEVLNEIPTGGFICRENFDRKWLGPPIGGTAP